MTASMTAKDIRRAMDALDFDEIARHFNHDTADEIDPFVVCEGVSVAAFNAYVGDGEGLRIGLRFLALLDEKGNDKDGRLVILDRPTAVHEGTVEEFASEFLAASGNRLEVASRGAMTATREARPRKEADATFGPKRTTLHRTPPPAPRTVTDWVTLAVEVGRSQTWASLVHAAAWWCGYAGIQYILLVKISGTRTNQVRYALYDIADVRGTLPEAPSASGTLAFRQDRCTSTTDQQAAVDVCFDMRRILSIPPHAALPPGVNQIARVDLRIVMDLVLDGLD